ncbi:MAG: PD-(D/E)XK nuclease family protein, partial [Acidobacteriota bacterium]
DRWLDARPDAAGSELFELRLALHTLGAARLRDVAALDPGRIMTRFGNAGFPLPIRTGLGRAEGPESDGNGAEADEDTPDRPLRRRIPARVLRRAVEDARRLVHRLQGWPGRAPFAEHLERLGRLLEEDLAWGGAREELDALARLEHQVPPILELGSDEVVLLLGRALRDAGRDRMGGAGGGVAVLDAVEARGRTFDHLFVVGLNRGVFPRPIREDPLLGDDLRGALLGVLPDLPLKRRGFAEERHLFAQLLAAAPEVTLSWQSTTDEGDPIPRSPLLDRILHRSEPLPAGEDETETEPGEDGATGPRPAAEHVVAAGLAGNRNAFSALLPIALEEAWTATAPEPPLGLDPAAVAAAHRAILDEMDPDLSTPDGRARRRGLGPYFGFVGRSVDPADPGDPRSADLWVTTLEAVAACPWQTFLQRVLRLEPTPDPLQAVPGLDALLVGSLVHAVLEEVVARELPEPHARDLAEADDREPVAVPWPEPDALEAILHDRAGAVLAEQGISMPGLERALAAAARPFLEAAREAEWSPRSPAVLAAEVTGSVAVTDASGAERPLRFRADRVDRMVDRRFPGLRLTDYKTGRPISEAVRQKTRDEHFLREVEAGKRLQAVAYALATDGPLPSMHAGQGRYAFVRPGLPPEQREAAVWGSHVPFVEAFEAAVRAGFAAWDRGAFFPRLVEPDQDVEPRRCSWCPVHEACVRGDSGARRRLAAFVETRRQGTLTPEGSDQDGDQDGDREGSATEALLDVWALPGRSGLPGRPGRSDGSGGRTGGGSP